MNAIHNSFTRLCSLIVIAVLMTACGSEGGPINPDNSRVVLGIQSGNHQTVKVASGRLPDSVVSRVVRTSEGLRLDIVPSGESRKDGVVVNGSPVPGATVCAVGPDGGPKPWTPCTNTDNDGHAIFWFDAGTRAGDIATEIRGTVNGQPAVFDTVVTTQLPLSPVKYYFSTEKHDGTPLILPPTTIHDKFGNPVPFAVKIDPNSRWIVVHSNTAQIDTVGDASWLTVQGDTVGTEAARTIIWHQVQPGELMSGARNVITLVGKDGTIFATLNAYLLWSENSIISIQGYTNGDE